MRVLFDDVLQPVANEDWITRATQYNPRDWFRPMDTFAGTPWNDAPDVMVGIIRPIQPWPTGTGARAEHMMAVKISSVQDEATEWRTVDPNENPGEWFVFSAGKTVVLDRLKGAVTAFVGQKIADILAGALGDSFELQIRYTGTSVVQREWMGWSEVVFDWSTFSWVTIWHFSGYGPAKRLTIDAHVEFRAYNTVTGESYVIERDRIPGAEDFIEFLTRLRLSGAPPWISWDIPDDFDYDAPLPSSPPPASNDDGGAVQHP